MYLTEVFSIMYWRMFLTTIGMLLLGSYYFLRKKTDRKKALFCKAAATSLPGVLLIWAVSAGRTTQPDVWVLAAILLYMAADVLLECKFVWGAVCFTIGHICMTVVFLTGNFNCKVILGAGVLFCLFTVAVYFALRKYIPYLKNKKLYLPAVIYVVLLSIMASLAVSTGILTGGIKGASSAAGGISFLISDVLLGQNRLGKRRSRSKGALVLVLYYLSVFFFVCSRIAS